MVCITFRGKDCMRYQAMIMNPMGLESFTTYVGILNDGELNAGCNCASGVANGSICSHACALFIDTMGFLDSSNGLGFHRLTLDCYTVT